MSQSITLLFDQLRQGDEEAARKLWEKYSRKLIDVAARQLASTRRGDYDEDDEIADKLSLSERTIERKLRLIRGDWSKALDGAQDEAGSINREH